MDENTASGNSVGIVVNVQGEAFAVSEGEIRELSIGSEVFEGEQIITKEDGQIEIKFQDNTILSQGENSEVGIDAYIYDPENGSNSNLLFQMTQGVFRTMTGEIAKQNPDHFNLKSPMALIGIRGTTVVGQVSDKGEQWGVEDIGEGHVLVVQDQFGNIQFISDPGMIIDFLQGQPINPARPLTPEELDVFQQTAPITPLHNQTGDDGGEEKSDDDAGNEGEDDATGDGSDEGDDDGTGSAGDDETPETYISPEGENNDPPLDPQDNPPPPPQFKILGLIDYTDPDDPDDPDFYSTGDEGEDLFGSEDPEEEEDTTGQEEEDAPAPLETPPPPNIDPTATDDIYDTAIEDTAITLTVLANDFDSDGGSLSITGVTQGSNGIVTNNGDNITYTPDSNFFGADSFTYTISDGQGGTDTALVSVTVHSENDPPVAVADPDIQTYQVEPVTIDVLGNDTDVEGDTLTITNIVDGVPDDGAYDVGHGHVTINNNGTLTYTPNRGSHGQYSFDYTVSDGNGGTDTATVTIMVNEPPTAVDDPDYYPIHTNEDTSTTINVLDNDSDPEDDDLSITDISGELVGIDTYNVEHGQVVINNTDGTLTYTPDENFNGQDTFTYTISDGYGGTDTATVTVNVDPENDAPVAGDSTVSIDEDTVLTNAVVIGSDVDGDNLEYSITSPVSNGTLTFDIDTGIYTYTPNANFHGTDTFSYSVTDGYDTEDTGTVTITVNPVNDAPTADNLTAETDEDSIFWNNVSGNDIDGDDLIYSVETGPVHGELSLNLNGSYAYTPDENYNGTDSFTYMVSDGNGDTDTATVTIDINAVDDDSEITGTFTGNVSEGNIGDAPVTDTGTLTITDVDDNDDPYFVDVVSTVGYNGYGSFTLTSGTWVYTLDQSTVQHLNAGVTDTDSITFTATDGTQQTVTVTITGTDDAATIFGDDITGSVTEDDYVTPNLLETSGDLDIDDPDTVDDTFVAGETPGIYGTFNIDSNGIWTYEADNTQVAIQGLGATSTLTDTFNVTTVNGASQDVVITINGDNDAPIFGTVPLDDQTATEGQYFSFIVSEDTFTDIDVSDNLRYTASLANDDVLPGWLTFDSTTRTFYGTPDSDESIIVKVTANDGIETISDIFEITVDPAAQNQAPIAVLDEFNIHQDEGISFSDSILLLNDSDPDGDDFGITEVSVTSVNDGYLYWYNGYIHYERNPDSTDGMDSFGYEITDENGATAWGEVIIYMEPMLPTEIIGTDGPDELYGNYLDNFIDGMAGNDIIYGYGGNDLLDGGEGNDELLGDDGDDLLDGGDGNDMLMGGYGDDDLWGGAGHDSLEGNEGNDILDGGSIGTMNSQEFNTASYQNDQEGITASLVYSNGNFSSSHVDQGTNFTDTLTNITDIIGSGNADQFYFDIEDNSNLQWTMIGMAGDDSMVAASGQDPDVDIRVSYQYDIAGIDADLSAASGGMDYGTVYDGFSGEDMLIRIQNLVGSNFGDTIVGSSHDNILIGGGGNDIIDGEYGIDHLFGEEGNDILIGGYGNDTIDGGDGRDILEGGSGSDQLHGGEGFFDQAHYHNNGTGITVTMHDHDSVQVAEGNGDTDDLYDIQWIRGTALDDTFIGDGRFMIYEGGAGDDNINAGINPDDFNDSAVSYWNDPFPVDGEGVYVDLNWTDSGLPQGVVQVTDGWLDNSTGLYGTDTLKNIVGVVGSRGNDTLIGNNEEEVWFWGMGGQGNDEIHGSNSGNSQMWFDNWAVYLLDPFGINATLNYDGSVNGTGLTGTVTDGWDDTDDLYDINGIMGSDHDDVITIISDGTFEGWWEFEGGQGNDTITGHAGEYTKVTYEEDISGVFVDLYDEGTVNHGYGYAIDGWGDTDLLFNINNVEGSGYDDTLIGNAQDNHLDGEEGNDILEGGAGIDTLDGEEGILDIADYHNDPYFNTYNDGTQDIYIGIDVTMGYNDHVFVRDGYGDTDNLYGIEWIRGTDYNDTFIGDGRFLFFEGGAGDNIITVTDGGDDDSDGYVSYWHAEHGININLNNADDNGILTVTDNGYDDIANGGTYTDTLTNVSEIMGSQHVDHLTGENYTHNSFVGGEGVDYLNGGAVNFNDGGDGNSAIYVLDPGSITADLYWDETITTPLQGSVTDGWGDIDELTNINSVIGSEYNDTLTIHSTSNYTGYWNLNGWAGDDTLTGFAGNYVQAEYSDSPYGIYVNLTDGTAQDGWGGTDTLSFINNIYASEHDDYIVGNDQANRLEGNGGNDTLIGGEGNDYLDGGDFEGTHPRNTADYQDDPGVSLGYGNYRGIDAHIHYNPEGGDNSFHINENHLSQVIDGWGDTDTLNNISRIKGSAFDDSIRITIDDTNNISDVRWYVWGMDGADEITGTDDEHVRAMYLDDPDDDGDGFGVSVDLTYGEAEDGWGNVDTLSRISAVSGSDYIDTLWGSVNGEGFFGTLGDDEINGYGGWDWVSYTWLDGENDFSGVEIDLALAYGQAEGVDSNGAELFTDDLYNIEDAEGSKFNDTIKGNSGNNWLHGWDGNDHIIGGAGYDTLVGGQGNDIIEGAVFTNIFPQNEASYERDPGGITATIHYDPSDSVNPFEGSNVIDGWGDTDTLINIARIKGSHFDDEITIDIDDDAGSDGTFWRVWGMGGNDTITGTAGEKVDAMYLDSPDAVTADLTWDSSTSILSGTVDDGWGGTDTLTNIRGVSGSHNASDKLNGSSTDDVFYGSLEDDEINGDDGFDTIVYASLNGNDWYDSDWYGTDFNGIEVQLLSSDIGRVNGHISGVSMSIFEDSISGIESFWGTDFDDIFDGNNNDNWFTGDGGADRYTGRGGNDVFRFTNSDAVDEVADFRGVSGTENDVLRFDESWDLGFNAQGTNPDTDNYISASSSPLNIADSTEYKIIGVTDNVASWNLSDVLSVFNSAVDTSDANADDDGTYLIVSNGSNSRVYFWEGDTNQNSGDIEDTIDESELTHFVNLYGFNSTDIGNLDEINFQIT